ncbi:MAG: tetratricopeptide repeat protein [Desulfomonile tiedjei]|uniref:Tetratricopeptide repeat protein n=1 Tax=Desulfomonile tiedjei TaxID=2358 RepID=A0A9D6V5T0_9BACT|nr:tetratricopeptide repeat protein [Desulfomonile tiedjei]
MFSDRLKAWEIRRGFGSIPLVFLLYYVIAAALYSPGLNAPMMYDSQSFIMEKSHLFAQGALSDLIGFVPSRPLMMLTHYFNYILTGMNPVFFRLVNILFLAGAGAAVAVLAALVLQSAGLPVEDSRRKIPILGVILGLILVVHPIQALSVMYIWQREAIAACFFYCGSLASYIGARSYPKREGLLYLAVAMLFAMGMFTKENVATLPAAFILAEITVLGSGIKDLAKRLPALAAITVAVMGLFLVVNNALHGASTPSDHEGIISRIALHYSLAQLALTEVLLTEARMMILYFFAIMAPSASSPGIVEAQVISRSIWTPFSTAVAVAGVIGMVLCALALLRKAPVISFGLGFFVVTLIPESLLIPQYLFCGYRAILPMVGILLIVGQLILWADARIKARTVRIASVLLGTGLVMTLCTQTLLRASSWTPLNVWADAYSRLPEFGDDVEKYPYLDVAVSFGVELAKRGNHIGAVDALQKAAKVELVGSQTKRSFALVHLGAALFTVGRQQEGVELFRRVLHTDPTDADAHNNLGAALSRMGNSTSGLEHLRLAVRYSPYNEDYRANLALSLFRSGLLDESISEYEKAMHINPLDWKAVLGLARATEKGGNIAKAVEYYRRALEIESESRELNFAAGNAFSRLNGFPEAAECYRRIIKTHPEELAAHFNLSTALIRAGQSREAVEVLRRAATFKADDPEVHYRLGLSLLTVGEKQQGIEHLRKALTLSPGHEKARSRLEALMGSENAHQN